MRTASHVIHNNTATFYDRNIVFPKLGFDSFTTLEYMNHVETNEIGWAKDKILTKEIVRALSETEERDLIYTISVQPHGAYPEESETADIKVLSGIEDPLCADKWSITRRRFTRWMNFCAH